MKGIYHQTIKLTRKYSDPDQPIENKGRKPITEDHAGLLQGTVVNRRQFRQGYLPSASFSLLTVD